MRASILVEKLWMENKEFATIKELKEYCKVLKLKHESVIHYLLKRKHLVRLFKGIYYIKSLEEFELGKSKYNHLELVARGLELKGVKNWYFGLHTALKYNNMTHEYFTIDEVISDSVFRANPVNIVGYKFKFVKISPSLLNFGIKESKNTRLRYSDPEKTILDFIYLSLQDGTPSIRVSMDVADWAKDISKNKLNKYAMKYPKTVAKTVEMMIK